MSHLMDALHGWSPYLLPAEIGLWAVAAGLALAWAWAARRLLRSADETVKAADALMAMARQAHAEVTMELQALKAIGVEVERLRGEAGEATAGIAIADPTIVRH